MHSEHQLIIHIFPWLELAFDDSEDPESVLETPFN